MTVYLDELSNLLTGSSEPLYPDTSGDYWVGFESTNPGLYFQQSTVSGEEGLMTLTVSTWPTGITANPTTDGNYVDDFGGSVGVDTIWPLYLGHMPDSTMVNDRAVALIETAGTPEDGRLGIESHGLQVVVRGAAMTSASTAFQEAEDEAQDLLDQLHEYTGSRRTLGQHYVGISNESGPFFTGFDASWRPLFSANYLALRSDAT